MTDRQKIAFLKRAYIVHCKYEEWLTLILWFDDVDYCPQLYVQPLIASCSCNKATQIAISFQNW